MPPWFDGSSNPGRHTSRCHGGPPFPSPPPWDDGHPFGDPRREAMRNSARRREN